MNNCPKITRDRRMWSGVAVSVAVTTGLTFALCAAVPASKTEPAQPVHPVSVSSSQSPTGTAMPLPFAPAADSLACR